ncbi:hypothetical protein [Roseicella frigidaeris]|nr:hypothetical protein [Roseicella frigidaeris]
MAKTPPVSYGGAVKLTPPLAAEPPPTEVVPAPIPTAPVVPSPSGVGEGGYAARRRPMESKSDPTIVYLHPEGKYELKRFALALGPKVKVHDLLMEAIEEWAQRKGIAAPMRVPSERQRRGQ